MMLDDVIDNIIDFHDEMWITFVVQPITRFLYTPNTACWWTHLFFFKLMHVTRLNSVVRDNDVMVDIGCTVRDHYSTLWQCQKVLNDVDVKIYVNHT